MHIQSGQQISMLLRMLVGRDKTHHLRRIGKSVSLRTHPSLSAIMDCGDEGERKGGGRGKIRVGSIVVGCGT